MKNNITTKEDSNNRQFGLDLIRTAAISLVLMSHFVKIFEYLGFWGVELFFGLSGFLIGHILWRNFSQTDCWSIRKIINFWSRRWWRTLPNYYLFFIISLVFHYLSDGQLPQINKLFKFLWFGQDFTERYGGFYGVSWSLCVEEWFYLLFPIILLILSFIRLNAKQSFFLSIMLIFCFCIATRQLLIYKGVGGDLRTITVARLDAIGSGVMIAYFTYIFRMTSKHKIILFGFGLLLLLSSIIIPYFLNMPNVIAINNKYLLILVPIGSSLILPYFESIKRPDGIFKLFAISVEKISRWSYSIYLSHIPILFTVYHLMDDFRNNIYGNILSKIFGLFLTILFSSIIFKFFEAPLTRRRPNELILSAQ